MNSTLGVKEVRAQSETALISVEAKKLLYQKFFNSLNDIQ